MLSRNTARCLRSARSIALSQSSALSSASRSASSDAATAGSKPLPISQHNVSYQDIAASLFAPLDTFTPRHIGPREADEQKMLKVLGYSTLDSFIDDVVPASIRIDSKVISDQTLPPLSESELYKRAKQVAGQNKVYKNFIGQGYHNAVVPPVIQRSLLENPAFYTQYTPYQAEISQGRLESLINFQTLSTSLTGLDISNASLLDEGTAAAEAMNMCFGQVKQAKHTFLVDRSVLPQTIAVLRTRAAPLGITIRVGNIRRILAEEGESATKDVMGVLVQYPAVRGDIQDWRAIAEQIHAAGALVVCATDLLALTMLQPPGEWGADIAIGNSARFGVPLGYGGPHAAFFSCKDKLKRRLSGRLIGLSKDVDGHPAYRLALQTREQHIRR